MCTIAKYGSNIVNGAIDPAIVEFDALNDIALRGRPVTVFEAQGSATGNLAESGVVAVESNGDPPSAIVDECVGGHRHIGQRLRIKASANSLHLTSVAPSMRRAKS